VKAGCSVSSGGSLIECPSASGGGAGAGYKFLRELAWSWYAVFKDIVVRKWGERRKKIEGLLSTLGSRGD